MDSELPTDTPAARLRWARTQRFDSAKDAAEALGIPYGTYSGHELGTRGVKLADWERYAVFFRTPVEWLVYGRGSPVARNVVPVVGIVSAGGLIESSSEQFSAAEPLFEIQVDDFTIPQDAFALEVRGTSMWPRYDEGDVIICYRHSQDPEQLLDWEAVVATEEGNRYLKRVLRGSTKGRYTLESHNAPPMRDVTITWVSEVRHVVRASRWRRLDIKSRRREVRKAKAA